MDHIPKVVNGRVGALLEDKLERDNFDYTVDALGKVTIMDKRAESDVCFSVDLRDVLQREVGQLSGGELQRFAIGVVAV